MASMAPPTTPSRGASAGFSSSTTPSRLRTTTLTPSRTFTPSRVPFDGPAPALLRPLKTRVVARDFELRALLQQDLQALDFALEVQEESIANAKQIWAANLAQLEDARRSLEVQLQEARVSGEELIRTLEKEREEAEAAKRMGKELEERRREMIGQVEALKADVQEWEQRVKRRKEEKGGKKNGLNTLKGLTEKEGQWLESLVGMKIRGKSTDVIQFKFVYIDQHNCQRPFTFDLDTSSPTYAIPECKPMLPKLPDLLHTLNTSRDFYAFIKAIRKAFKAYAEAEPRGRR